MNYSELSKYELFKLWAEGKLPHQSDAGSDHHAIYALQRFEMWLAGQERDND